MAKIPPTKAEFTFEERMLRISSLSILDAGDIAAWLNVSESWVRHMVSGRGIPHCKTAGGRIYFSKEDIEDWMKKFRVPTREELESQAATYTALNRPNARARR